MNKSTLVLILLLSALLFPIRPASGNSPEITKVTFAKQIAPLFQKRCEECHRTGGVAPMSCVS